MSSLTQFKLKIKRGEGPFYGFMRKVVIAGLRSNLPQPRFLKPVFHAAYDLHFAVLVFFRRLLIYFYREPLFRSRCSGIL